MILRFAGGGNGRVASEIKQERGRTREMEREKRMERGEGEGNREMEGRRQSQMAQLHYYCLT